jgi:hypothetical protein
LVITRYFETKVLFQRHRITEFLQDDKANVCFCAPGNIVLTVSVKMSGNQKILASRRLSGCHTKHCNIITALTTLLYTYKQTALAVQQAGLLL